MRQPQGTRIISIDYGLARIGIAYSDERKIIASPLMTLTTERKLENTVAKLINELASHQKNLGYVIEEIVVGLPLMMNGKQGLIADEVKLFVDMLQKSIPFPVVTWDERLTSVQAERALMESTLSRKKRTKFVDRISAVIILQNYLDRKSMQQI